MNTYRSQLLKFRRATYVPSRAQRLIVKSSMYEGEENREKLMHDFKLNLSKSFQECIITPKTFTQIVNQLSSSSLEFLTATDGGRKKF